MEDYWFQHIGEEIRLAGQTIEAGVLKRMQRLKAVKISRGQCCDLVLTFSSGVRESFKLINEVLDLLADPETRQSTSEVTTDTTNIPESSTSQNRCKASRWRMPELCLYSLAELDRCLEMGEAYQLQCSDVQFWRTALRMSIVAPNPSEASLHTELSCISREFAWSVDVIQLAFTSFKVLLLTGMDLLQQDVAFEWCARSCRVVLNGIGKYHIFQENHSVLDSNSVQDSDEKELLRMLKEIASEKPWFPSAYQRHRGKIASFLRQKVAGPAPRTDYLPTTFQIDHRDIHVKDFLDVRSSSSVVQCEWQGEMVAVKCLTGCHAEARKNVLDKEVALLASVQHPNIVQLIGFAYKEKSNTGMIVMELMPMDLRNLIDDNLRKKCIVKGTVPEFEDDSTPFPLDVAIHILLQIAEGMCHLRSLRVMHRDLKGANVLVNPYHHGRSHPSEARCDVQNERESFYHVKLADFGTSKSQPLVSKFRTKAGTRCWMAPEVLEVESNSGQYSRKYTWSADVYSFGITCSEVLTGLLPFQDISTRDLLSMIRSGKRPPLPPDCPARFRKLISDCWATDPESRPDFVEIRERLWQCRFEMLLNDDKILRRKSFRDKLRAMSSSSESQRLGDRLIRHAFSPASLLQKVSTFGLKKEPAEMATFDNLKPTIFPYAELPTDTRAIHPSITLGQGSDGFVFKVKLLNGMEVAVERLFVNNRRDIEEFLNEVVSMNGVRFKRHCLTKRRKLLLYEYVENHDLGETLFGVADSKGGNVLTWPIRLNISLGVACGLQYLHRFDDPRIIHHNIKASKFLVDKNCHPKLANFGLVILLPFNEVNFNVLGTSIGYLAPEYFQGQLTEKIDVYSFGVLVLETVSARKSIDPNYSPPNEMLLVDQAWKLHDKGKLMDLVDPKFYLDIDDVAIVYHMIYVALLCLLPNIEKRPSMEHVVACLQGEVEGFRISNSVMKARQEYNAAFCIQRRWRERRWREVRKKIPFYPEHLIASKCGFCQQQKM